MSGPSPGKGGIDGPSAATPEPSDLVVNRLRELAKSRPTAPALMQRTDGGSFVPVTWAEYQDLVHAFAAACIAVGLPVGGAVGIIGEGRLEWVVAALGAMSAGGMAAGIYQTGTAEQSAYILNHCDAMLVVIENAAQWDKLAPQLAELPKLRRIVFMAGEVPAAAKQAQSSAGGPLGQSFTDFLASGTSFAEAVDKRVAALLPDQVASLIYTSGTTGQPKGVMLTHHNLAWTAQSVLKIYPLRDDEVVASYLPLSHIAEQLLTLYVALQCGACVYFAGSMDNLLDTLIAARPTIFLAVPRVWEKLQDKIAEGLAAAKPVRRRVIAWARDVGTRSGSYRLESGSPYGLLLLEEKLAAKLFFTKLKTALGLDRVRLALSGAAAIRKDVLEFFLSLQVPIHEVYGLSECTGPMTMNGPQGGKTRLGTVGRVIPGGMLKLAPDGEVLYQGPNVFAGYFKDDQSTGAALHGGWLHTGDIGELDGDGFLRITDRKKDLFKTSGGRYVAPTPIEGALRTIPLVSQALVVGENRRYIVALLTLDADRGRAFAREHGLPESLDELVAHEKVRTYLQEHIDRLNRGRERVETVKRFTLLASDFTVEADEVTPTQKLRRPTILSRYAKDIEAMYDDERDDSKIV